MKPNRVFGMFSVIVFSISLNVQMPMKKKLDQLIDTSILWI